MKLSKRLVMLLLTVALLFGQGLSVSPTPDNGGDATLTAHDTTVVEAGFGGGYLLQKFFRWLRSLFDDYHGGGDDPCDGAGGAGDGGAGDGAGGACPGAGDGPCDEPGRGGGDGTAPGAGDG